MSQGSTESVGLNCETERMKVGAVRDVNSLSALMIARDDHDSARSAAPKPRHHLQGFFRKVIKYQNDNERRGMMHNHPSGDPTPSDADISMTHQVKDACEALGLTLHDHLIIGKSRELSFRAQGYL